VIDFLKTLFGHEKTKISRPDAPDKSLSNSPSSSSAPEKTPSINRSNDDKPMRKLGVKFMEEYVAQYISQASSRVKLADLPIWKTIQSLSPDDKAKLCLWAYRGRWTLEDCETEILVGKSYNASEAKQKLAGSLIRSKLPYSEIQIASLLQECASRQSLQWDNPVKPVLGHLERFLDDGALSKTLQTSLKKLHKTCQRNLQYSQTEALQKLKVRIEAILYPTDKPAGYTLPRGKWALIINKDLAFVGSELSPKWLELFEHAGTANGSKPSQKWLKTGAEKIAAIGTDTFHVKLSDWMAQTRMDPAQPDAAADVIKGLVWLTVNHPSDAIALAVGRFAENCYVKVPNIGARSKKVGNACLTALMLMQNSKIAIAQLVRLRDKIKYPSVRKSIDKKLDEVARKKGVTVEQLEDESLPSFGFDLTGRRVETFGDFSATLMLIGAKAELNWADAAGKPRKTVPAAVKADFKTELKDLKQLAKDITAILVGQVKILDHSYVAERSWPYGAWTAQYLDHPLRAQISKSLIWEVTEGGKTTTVLPTEAGLLDISGQLIKPSSNAQLRLWHPLYGTTEDILVWRQKIEALEIVQPFKQAHREIYVVTDAELGTNIYSNRFAAHILRQHQFKALCTARGWSYTLQGMWDSWNIPTRVLPRRGINVQFAVNMIEEAEQSGSGIPLYLTSDHVRFYQNHAEMRMETIPPIIFSEVMRDVDLFVAVSSVASDPAWTDGGPEGRFGTYWQQRAFGELGESAKTRREIIANLVPKLAFSDKLEIGDKVLKVQGTRHAYHIHFGSGNIMIMPGNKYLCIVRAPNSQKQEKIYLPFEGDTLVSIILSKAQMLINDDKIKDRTILSQL